MSECGGLVLRMWYCGREVLGLLEDGFVLSGSVSLLGVWLIFICVFYVCDIVVGK